MKQDIEIGNNLLENDCVESEENLVNDDGIDSLSDESDDEIMAQERPTRQCVGKGVSRLEVNFNNKTYDDNK